MALIWNFEKRCGTVTMKDGFTRYMYEGNAFFILLNEWKEDGGDMYSLYTFAVDPAHAKECARRAVYDNVTSVVLYKDVCREWKKISAFFAEYCDGVTITYKRSAK